MLKYCIFWYPTIWHEDLTPLKKEIPYTDISDDDPVPHFVSIKLLENKNLLILSALDANGTKDKIELTLTYKDSSHNGLFFYEFDNAFLSESHKRIEEALESAIYHLSKELYHKHEHHGVECDSSLEAYIFPESPLIRKENNPALIHYLKEYQNKFNIYSERFTNRFSHILATKDDANYKDKFFALSEMLDKDCSGALGEAIYCSTLKRSKYYNPTETCNQSEAHRIAINIENSLRDIEHIKEKNKSFFDYKHGQYVVKSLVEGEKLAKDGNKIGKKGIAIGVATALVCLAISSAMPMCTSQKLDLTPHNLKMDSIRYEQNKITDEMDSIKLKNKEPESLPKATKTNQPK